MSAVYFAHFIKQKVELNYFLPFFCVWICSHWLQQKLPVLQFSFYFFSHSTLLLFHTLFTDAYVTHMKYGATRTPYII